MRTIGNILWLLLAGIWLALTYAAAGVIMLIFIITIPWAIGAFRMANYALWPFGRAVVPKADKIPGTCIANVLWFVFAGLWVAIAHAVTGVVLCITIIGIPWGIGSFKMIPIALAPLGKQIIDIDDIAAGTPGAIYAPGPR
ncbi:MAG: YccF domain-containing protein [Micrococcales bacterium]|jgi:uncharacterized membrane protein YccF (DUF307 family)|nr:YccF domain-containing protein [Micrococcales bacterium]